MAGTAQGAVDADDLRFVAETRHQVQELFDAYQAGTLSVSPEVTATLWQIREHLLSIKLDWSVNPEATDDRNAVVGQIAKIAPKAVPQRPQPARRSAKPAPAVPPASIARTSAESAAVSDQPAPQEPPNLWSSTRHQLSPPTSAMPLPEVEGWAPPVPQYPGFASPDPQNYSWATAPTRKYRGGRALVLGLLGLVLPLFSLFGLVYGVQSYRLARKHPGLGSKGLALAGIVVSVITPVAVVVAVLTFYAAPTRLKMAPVRQFVAEQAQSEFQTSSHQDLSVAVSCPASVLQRSGVTFSCTATASGSTRIVHVQVSEVDDSGGVTITGIR